MDILSDRLRILENESRQNRSAPANGPSLSLPSNSGSSLSPNPDSIMNWSKSEFVQIIKQNTQDIINEILKEYRNFQAGEIDSYQNVV
jgi:hypothetical protein